MVATLTIMAGATISPSLPAIEAHFAATPDAALLTRMVLTLPALTIALSAPFAGWAVDRFGRRRLLLGSIVLYGLAGSSGLFAATLPGLLVGRALLGLAVACIMTLSAVLAADYFAGPARDRFIGLQSAFTGVGGLIFLLLGGALADGHWRLPFALYALSLLLLPCVAIFMREAQAPSFPVSRALPEPGAGVTPWGVLALFFGAAVVNSVVFYLIPTQLPFHLRELGAAAPSQAGMAIGVLSLCAGMTSVAYGRLRGGLGLAGAFAAGFGLMSAGYALLSCAETLVGVIGAAMVVGLGLGLVMPNLSAGAMAFAPTARRGQVSGVLTTSIFIGQFLSPLLSQPFGSVYGLPALFVAAAGSTATLALAALGAAFIRRRRRNVRRGSQPIHEP